MWKKSLLYNFRIKLMTILNIDRYYAGCDISILFK